MFFTQNIIKQGHFYNFLKKLISLPYNRLKNGFLSWYYHKKKYYSEHYLNKCY